MTISEILLIEGIVVRMIPKTKISIYEERHFKNKDNQVLFYSNEFNRYMVRETKQNSLGGKYLITRSFDQSSSVNFNKNYCGIGDNIKDAYLDYCKKNDK